MKHSTPPLIIAAVSGLSGVAGSLVMNSGIWHAPEQGIYSVPVGLLFGAVIALAVWRWGGASAATAALALLATAVGWQAAVGFAIKLETSWLLDLGVTESWRMTLAGFAAGALGAALTWAGAAYAVAELRTVGVAQRCIITGAVLGMLLPLTNRADDPAILLVPWQAAIGFVIGLALPAWRTQTP